MSSAVLEFPVIEESSTITTDDEFELDLRVTIYAGLEGQLPQMCQSHTCGCSNGFSCYGTCTIDNCGGPSHVNG